MESPVSRSLTPLVALFFEEPEFRTLRSPQTSARGSWVKMRKALSAPAGAFWLLWAATGACCCSVRHHKKALEDGACVWVGSLLKRNAKWAGSVRPQGQHQQPLALSPKTRHKAAHLASATGDPFYIAPWERWDDAVQWTCMKASTGLNQVGQSDDWLNAQARSSHSSDGCLHETCSSPRSLCSKLQRCRIGRGA